MTLFTKLDDRCCRSAAARPCFNPRLKSPADAHSTSILDSLAAGGPTVERRERVMADQQMPHLGVVGRQVVECGGLRFDATFRAPAGATLRVFGDVDGHDVELLRFDDFIEGPHYHIPAAGDPIAFDQAALGEPLTWLVPQLSDHLAEL